MPASRPPLKFPMPVADEREVLLGFLDAKRAAVLKTADGLTDEQARWHPDGKLLSVAGVINHLTRVEGRWIDGRLLGQEPPERTDEEFTTTAPLADLVEAYCVRREQTNGAVRSAAGMVTPCPGHPSQPPRPGLDLRWVVVHLIEETAHHAGHADSTRELLDGHRSTN
jgi:uncharacterized damage-inducible protein DinB